MYLKNSGTVIIVYSRNRKCKIDFLFNAIATAHLMLLYIRSILPKIAKL